MKPAARVVFVAAALFLVVWSMPRTASGSGPDQPNNEIVKRSDVYCTGYISETPVRHELKVIGGEKENEKESFAQGDVVYLNQGRDHGVRSGAVYYVVRPTGLVKHPTTRKFIGTFVRELGMLRVIEVQNKTATAEVIVSCDQIDLGDSLTPYEAKAGPSPSDPKPLPRYTEGVGGMLGQIIMAPTGREYFSANNIVYIDLGSRNGVQPGDNFTIYRTINKREGVTAMPDDNLVDGRSYGYGSLRYKGTEQSNSSLGEKREDVMRTRPSLPRKVLGEMTVVKVENGTAVAVITRTVGEVNIGDYIERVR
jgi:hypothetical protein